MLDELSKYANALSGNLENIVEVHEPKGLYEPIAYIISLGGKRLRPILTLMAADFFSEDFKEAINAAIAVELFHNFSLIHDDIMDNAPLRRGEETVHEKWDLNTGILSGDAMLILAYQLFEGYEPARFQQLAKLFSKTALQVCEGQQYDVDFETRSDVTIAEYTKMIDYKTAVLIGAALKMGAIVANASISCKENIYNFGRNLGIAFQLQDDYLDAFGNPETFGKQVGGDIIANKKTYLYLTAIEKAVANDATILKQLFSETPEDPSTKIEVVKEIFITSGAKDATLSEIKRYTQKANALLNNIKLPNDKKESLKSFGNWLMKRTV